MKNAHISVKKKIRHEYNYYAMTPHRYYSTFILQLIKAIRQQLIYIETTSTTTFDILWLSILGNPGSNVYLYSL